VFLLLSFLQLGGERRLKKVEGKSKGTRTKYFKNIKREEDIDDFTFHVWKSELQKELPSFWESLIKL
jgi:hypothetical protein